MKWASRFRKPRAHEAASRANQARDRRFSQQMRQLFTRHVSQRNTVHDFWRRRLSYGTSLERNTPESLTRGCSRPFTATCRSCRQHLARSGVKWRILAIACVQFIDAGESRAKAKSQPSRCRNVEDSGNIASDASWSSRWPGSVAAKLRVALPAGSPSPPEWG